MQKINVTLSGHKTWYYEDESEFLEILYSGPMANQVLDESTSSIAAFTIAQNCALTTVMYNGNNKKQKNELINLLESSRVVMKDFVRNDSVGQVDLFINALIKNAMDKDRVNEDE